MLRNLHQLWQESPVFRGAVVILLVSVGIVLGAFWG